MAAWLTGVDRQLPREITIDKIAGEVLEVHMRGSSQNMAVGSTNSIVQKARKQTTDDSNHVGTESILIKKFYLS